MIKVFGGNRGYVLLDCLLAISISSFVGAILLEAFASTLRYWEFVSEVRAAWVKSERIFLVVESRVVNAGLGVSSDIFAKEPLLSGWKNALEIMDASDVPIALVKNADSDDVASGPRMGVLSSLVTVTNYLISSNDWAPGAPMTLPSGFANRWWTIPSLGVPFKVQPNNVAVNPSTETWRGVDMPNTFRIAYFHVEKNSQGEDVFYMKDSEDTVKQPIMSDITAARFELNKTKKTLTVWVSVSTSKKTREISRTWKIRNLRE